MRKNEREVVQLRQQLQESQQLHRGTQEAMTEKERQLGQMRQQVESNERERANLEKRLLEKDRQLHELEGQLLRLRDQKHLETARKVDRKGNIKLVWREEKKTLFARGRYCDAVVDGSKVYFRGDFLLFTYNISDKGWSRLPDGPFSCTSLAILNGQLTTIGGTLSGNSPFTNKLMSLTMEGKWIEKFPPMPTKRVFVTAVCTGTVLIVAGGLGENYINLTTVEVLNFENSQWSTAVDLPKSLSYCSATVHDDQLYMLGDIYGNKSMYTCSVSALLQTSSQKSSLEERTSALSLSSSSSGNQGVWSELPDLLVTESTCVTFCGQFLAINWWERF